MITSLSTAFTISATRLEMLFLAVLLSFPVANAFKDSWIFETQHHIVKKMSIVRTHSVSMFYKSS